MADESMPVWSGTVAKMAFQLQIESDIAMEAHVLSCFANPGQGNFFSCLNVFLVGYTEKRRSSIQDMRYLMSIREPVPA
jgi:hypothetical protein